MVINLIFTEPLTLKILRKICKDFSKELLFYKLCIQFFVVHMFNKFKVLKLNQKLWLILRSGLLSQNVREKVCF